MAPITKSDLRTLPAELEIRQVPLAEVLAALSDRLTALAEAMPMVADLAAP